MTRREQGPDVAAAREASIYAAAEAAWMADGACRDVEPELFFPNEGVGVERARTICKRCPVCEACLDYAIAHHIEHGVWGGTSERGRRRIAQERRRPWQ